MQTPEETPAVDALVEAEKRVEAATESLVHSRPGSGCGAALAEQLHVAEVQLDKAKDGLAPGEDTPAI